MIGVKSLIDFKNGSFFKLSRATDGEGKSMVTPMLVDNEVVFAEFVAVRDRVVFTNKRVISINVQGLTGKKKDFSSLPYSKIQAFSIETAGTFDVDCELDLFFSGLGRVRFEFKSGFDIVAFNKHISQYIL
jgi:hypothetical protein